MIKDRKIIKLKVINSTNTYLTELIKSGDAKDRMVVIAEEQTHGRGRSGNTWYSSKGLNLTFSIALFPVHLKVDKQFIISMAVSMGIYEYISSKTSGVSIKWPNDIYILNKKVCGTLIELSIKNDSIASVVVGIGLNLNQTQFTEELLNPVSLSAVTGYLYDIDAELLSLLGYVDKYVDLITIAPEKIFDCYVSNLYQKGIWSQYIINNIEIIGNIVGVDSQGRLLLDKNGEGISAYELNEVTYVLS